jgi:hypothetical protein
VAIQPAGVNFVVAWGKEWKMYSPVLNESLVKTMYRLKRVWKKPMTEIAEELIKKSLYAVEKEFVCRVCIGERNNDCESCYLEKNPKKEGGEQR